MTEDDFIRYQKHARRAEPEQSTAKALSSLWSGRANSLRSHGQQQPYPVGFPCGARSFSLPRRKIQSTLRKTRELPHCESTASSVTGNRRATTSREKLILTICFWDKAGDLSQEKTNSLFNTWMVSGNVETDGQGKDPPEKMFAGVIFLRSV